MATFRRALTAGATYFFTVVTRERIPLLSRPEFLSALRDAVRLVRAELPFGIVAWVVLPDHLHCIWRLPEGDWDYARRWSVIKCKVSQATAELLPPASEASRLRRRESSLWQRRFWEHQIRDDDDLRKHVDYIHWNPVKHGCVLRAADWSHSTIHRYVSRGELPADWGGSGEIEGRFGE